MITISLLQSRCYVLALPLLLICGCSLNGQFFWQLLQLCRIYIDKVFAGPALGMFEVFEQGRKI